MKFGKRGWESKVEEPPAKPPAEPVAEGWNVRADPEPVPRSDAAPAAESVEPAVDGEAVELPMTEVVPDEAEEPAGEPLSPPAVTWVPTPPPMPFPVAEEPVLVYSSGPGSEPSAVTPLADAGEAHASGHAPGMSPSWPEPVMQLASERPEVLVGAAFAGGALFAMILRRLGN